MRKNFPFLLFLLMLGLIIIPVFPAMAAGAEWQLTWNDDGSIREKVIVDGSGLIAGEENWKSYIAGDKTVYERETRDWEAYQQLNDRLPFTVESKNFFLWQNIKIKTDENIVSSSGLFAQAAAIKDSKLIINVPGVIQKSSGIQAKEDQAVFKLADFTSAPAYLQVVTIQGLWLGLVLFTLAFIVILFYYLGRIRRVNRLIEDEYSLEKALEQLEKEEKENAENDNNQDEK